MRISVLLLLTIVVSLSACSSVNTAALADNEVSVNIRDWGLFCRIKVETNPNSCSGIAQAVSGDICVVDGTVLQFKSLRKRNNQFLIVPAAVNPLFAADGSSGCAVISEDGILECQVKNPTGQSDPFKYWVFGQGCSQSLDPRIYVLSPRG